MRMVFTEETTRGEIVESEVIAALITAGGTVMAALIGVAGVYGIFKRKLWGQVYQCSILLPHSSPSPPVKRGQGH
jgi:hypothetical protein